MDENLPWYGHSENAVKVRRAMSMAIDRDAINNAFYDGDGEPVIVSLFHPGLGPWKSEWEARYNELHAYNPEMARQLLAEAGYPDGISGYKWALYFIDIAPEGLDIAEAVVAMWKEIGVEIEIETTERSTWAAPVEPRKPQDTSTSGTPPMRQLKLDSKSTAGAAGPEPGLRRSGSMNSTSTCRTPRLSRR